MAEPPGRQLQSMLQAAVKSVRWTYSLFWQICPQRGLVWAEGYYNGAIKTRKTVQPMEVSTEEASVQRSQQLRELYDSLSRGETNQPARRPSAALSPEDLTESEWFYLMCLSFSFAPGTGLPGKAFSRRQHVWLTGAHEVDSKTFSRAILAKSARVQTVVCIPLMDGVVEFGNTDKVRSFKKTLDSFNTLKPSSQITITSAATNTRLRHHQNQLFQSTQPLTHQHPTTTTLAFTPLSFLPSTLQLPPTTNQDGDDEAESDSNSDAETGGNRRLPKVPNLQNAATATAAEASELMLIEMPQDIRLESSDDGSNNLETDFHLPTVTLSENHNKDAYRANSGRGESTPRWPLVQDPSSRALRGAPSSGQFPLEEIDTQYFQTVVSILQNHSSRWAEASSSRSATFSTLSTFVKWTIRSDHRLNARVEGSSQRLLKYILFTIPFLHSKYQDENSSESREAETANRFRKGTPQDELSGYHVLVERRRREKLNERFVILRSLVPFVTKTDKASILGDTIEYVKLLRKKIQDLECRNRQMETDHRSKIAELQKTNNAKENRSVERTWVGTSLPEKRKMIIVEGREWSAKAKPVELSAQTATSLASTETKLEVSIIERDALLEIECGYKEGLLLDVMQLVKELRIEPTTVQSSSNGGVFAAELRAKVKESENGKRRNIVEVKRAIQQIIPKSTHPYS